MNRITFSILMLGLSFAPVLCGAAEPNPASEETIVKDHAPAGSGTLILAGSSAATPAPAAKGSPVSSESGVAQTALGEAEQHRWLPVYHALFDTELMKELGINLSAEQLKRLHEIAADCEKKAEEFSKDRAKWEQLLKDCGKQVEAILAPQQLQAYKNGMLPFQVFDRLVEYLRTIGLTREQEKKLAQFFSGIDEQNRQEVERMERATNGLLAALSPQQREKLNSEVEHLGYQVEEQCLLGPCGIGTYGVLTATAVSGGTLEGTVAVAIPVYGELGDTAIVTKLGLSADQRKQLTKVATEYQRETGKFIGEVKTLLSEQRKRLKVQEKAVRMVKEAGGRIEAILTPQQVAELKETIMRNRASMVVLDPAVQTNIELNDQQKASLLRARNGMDERLIRIQREAQRKAFGVLTLQQQEKLREEAERRRCW